MDTVVGEICGIAMPLQIEGQHFALCTRSPHKTGEHKCLIEHRWPGMVILEEGATVLVSRFKVSKKKRPFLSLAMEVDKAKQESEEAPRSST